MAGVIYESVRGLTSLQLEDHMLKKRIVWLTGEVTDARCDELVKELLHLECEDSTLPITLFINSPGGSVSSGLAVYDTIRLLRSPVVACVTGLAASMGAIILLACQKENRYMLPSARVLIHDCSWGSKNVGGMKPFQIEQELTELRNINKRLIDIIATQTGHTEKQVSRITMEDRYFDAKESIEFGLVGKVLDEETFDRIIHKGE